MIRIWVDHSPPYLKVDYHSPVAISHCFLERNAWKEWTGHYLLGMNLRTAFRLSFFSTRMKFTRYSKILWLGKWSSDKTIKVHNPTWERQVWNNHRVLKYFGRNIGSRQIHPPNIPGQGVPHSPQWIRSECWRCCSAKRKIWLDRCATTALNARIESREN